MFTTVFVSIIRCVAVPIVAFFALRELPGLNDTSAFLIIAIVLTVTNILSILWSVLKIIPSLMLLRGGRILRIFVKISIEIISIIGFWAYYIINYRS